MFVRVLAYRLSEISAYLQIASTSSKLHLQETSQATAFIEEMNQIVKNKNIEIIFVRYASVVVDEKSRKAILKSLRNYKNQSTLVEGSDIIIVLILRHTF